VSRGSGEFEFKGHDWTELVECWNLELTPEQRQEIEAAPFHSEDEDAALLQLVSNYASQNFENPEADIIPTIKRYRCRSSSPTRRRPAMQADDRRVLDRPRAGER